jgi:hypothetical protein
MKKCFVLGVGAQKSGTTWLHKYLSSNTNVNFGTYKEYHIWDALFIKECNGFAAREKNSFRYRLQNEYGAYEKYFSNLIYDGVNITGDITPSYSGLSADCFKLIREKIESSGFDLKVIFLMRDPFERCWSAVRMNQRNRSKKMELTEFEELKNSYRTRQFIFRTKYNLTIESLEKAFTKDQIYYGIYEEIFDHHKIEEISKFIGVQFRPEFSKEKFNTSPKMNHVAIALKDEIKEFYSDVYEFCFDRFPQTRLLWG